MKHILKCQSCGNYTMKESCSCRGKAVSVRPPKYSAENKYGSYRRQVKKEELVNRGFL